MYEQTDAVVELSPGRAADVSERNPQSSDSRARIEQAVGALDELDDLPLVEHVERFDAVHTELAVALSSIDQV